MSLKLVNSSPAVMNNWVHKKSNKPAEYHRAHLFPAGRECASERGKVPTADVGGDPAPLLEGSLAQRHRG